MLYMTGTAFKQLGSLLVQRKSTICLYPLLCCKNSIWPLSSTSWIKTQKHFQNALIFRLFNLEEQKKDEMKSPLSFVNHI